MRWITFSILLYVCAALQVTHFLTLSAHGSYPAIQYLPLLAIFYALFADEKSAPLAGFACGILYDLTSGGMIPFGTQAVPLALLTLLVVRIRMSIFRERVISQIVISFVALLFFALLVALLSWLLLGGGLWAAFGPMSANAVYSAFAAPLLFRLWMLLKGFLGFDPHRHRSR